MELVTKHKGIENLDKHQAITRVLAHPDVIWRGGGREEGGGKRRREGESLVQAQRIIEPIVIVMAAIL